MRKYYFSLIILALFLSGCDGKPSEASNSAKQNLQTFGNYKSCYDEFNETKFKKTDIFCESFVVIDQTTIMDANLQKNLLDKIEPLFVIGNAFTVAKFSTFSQNRYTSIVVDGYIEKPLTADEENDVPRNKLNKIKECFNQKVKTVNSDIKSGIKQALSESSSTLARSELFKSFQDLADSRIKQSNAREKIVILASDMLENSSISSFYANGGESVRKIEPEEELKKVKQAGLLADFKGAKIYVIGAGLLAKQNRQDTGRDVQTMINLKKFWEMYFSASNAQLVAFGSPELLENIH
ncbi:MAG: hypothetical protein PHE67_06025 [Campylobacterales bacterium]|nr:hypothetical protein [Campylobacterales bacterium]